MPHESTFTAEARAGGLRRRAKGSPDKLVLSRVQLELVKRLTTDAPTDTPTERRLVIAAIEMGLGKTLAALAALCVLRGRAEGGRVRALFVVPKSTLYDSWRRQRRAFTTLTGSALQVVTYARLQRAYTDGWSRSSPAGAGGRRSSAWARGIGDPLLETVRELVVFDESHVLRNPNTLLGRAAAVVSANSRRVLCLTGTPVHNGPADASGQLRAMGSGSALEDPTAFGSRSMLQGDAVHTFASSFVYKATLADAGVTLPPKSSEIHWVEHELNAQGVAAYNTSLRAVNGLIDDGDDAVDGYDEDVVPGAVRHNLLIMRQLCVEPALFHKHGRPEFDDTARSLTVASPGPKLRAALDLVRRLVFEGHSKIVIVSEFVALLDTFRDLAAARLGEAALSFDGRLSAQARSRVVDEFLTGESRLLCLSLGAGAYGLNLAGLRIKASF
jgi:hypothetical protein